MGGIWNVEIRTAGGSDLVAANRRSPSSSLRGARGEKHDALQVTGSAVTPDKLH